VDRGLSGSTMGYDSGTTTFTTDPYGNGPFQLLGVWNDGSNIPKLGWKPIASGSSTTAEGDTLFRPTACSGKPAYAFCVQVAGTNASDNDKNCWFIRLASTVQT
jgi:hypothetical protein